MSRAYTTEGHLNERIIGCHDCPAELGLATQGQDAEVYGARSPRREGS